MPWVGLALASQRRMEVNSTCFGVKMVSFRKSDPPLLVKGSTRMVGSVTDSLPTVVEASTGPATAAETSSPARNAPRGDIAGLSAGNQGVRGCRAKVAVLDTQVVTGGAQMN